MKQFSDDEKDAVETACDNAVEYLDMTKKMLIGLPAYKKCIADAIDAIIDVRDAVLLASFDDDGKAHIGINS